MSNIYIQEPPTNGKILLKTSVGEIEIELWSKEAVKTCRNFVQLCLDGHYNKSLFHRVVKGFIVQGGESNKELNLIEPVKNEFHSRLRFNRRGLVAMATSGDAENNMQFFFTLAETTELQNTHTIFGKVTGETIYNMLKLEECETDYNDRPLYPHKINKVSILSNPFDDIEKRTTKDRDNYEVKEDSRKKSKMEAVKNFKLLSFGDEEAENEKEIVTLTTKKTDREPEKKKDKESDKKSRKEKDIESKPSTSKIKKPEEKKAQDSDESEEEYERKPKSSTKFEKPVESDSDSDYTTSLELEKKKTIETKKKEIQDEIRNIKKQYHKDRKEKQKEEVEEKVQTAPVNDTVKAYLEEKEKYKSKKLPKTNKSAREQFTLSLLAKFKDKLQNVKTTSEEEPEQAEKEKEEEDGDGSDPSWLSHSLDFSQSEAAVLAKDASTKSDDWFDIYDPRNPINKRKRLDAIDEKLNKKKK